MNLVLFYKAYLWTVSGSLLSSFPSDAGEQEVQDVQSNVTIPEHATTHPTVQY